MKSECDYLRDLIFGTEHCALLFIDDRKCDGYVTIGKLIENMRIRLNELIALQENLPPA
jgi:hypothetical protein